MVDTGASETVIGEGLLSDIQIREGAASRRGAQYETAHWERIAKLCELSFARVTAQVCEVNKALLSVRRMMVSGHTVVFSEDGSHILNDGTDERARSYMTNMACSQ